MTVIAAARTASGIVMAADSLGVSGQQKMQLDSSTKLWCSGPYVFGGAGDLRTVQVVRHFTNWPTYRPDEDRDLEAFLVKRMVPAIREAVDGHGIIRCNGGVESIQLELLVAFGDTALALIYGNGCVGIDTSGRMAAGSGTPEALGSLGHTGPWTEDSVLDAVRAAIRNDRSCGGPIAVADTVTRTVREVAA